MDENYKDKPKTSTDGAKHTICNAENKMLQEKLMSTPVTLKKSPEKESFPNNHEVRGPSMKYVSASKVERKREEGIMGYSEPKIKSKDEDSELNCCNKTDGKPFHVDVDKENTRTDEKLQVLPYCQTNPMKTQLTILVLL